MGFFAFMYYQSFIAQYKASVGDVMQIAVQGLEADEILQVVTGLSKYLVSQRLVEEPMLGCLVELVAKKR